MTDEQNSFDTLEERLNARKTEYETCLYPMLPPIRLCSPESARLPVSESPAALVYELHLGSCPHPVVYRMYPCLSPLLRPLWSNCPEWRAL